MKTAHDQTLEIIHDLIQTCKDGYHGFHAAAQEVKSPELRSIFLDFSAQRLMFVNELERRARFLGDTSEQSGSIGAALHRGWMNVKASVAGHHDHAILEECERGEDNAIEAYRTALSTMEIDPDSRELFTRQFISVKASHDRIRDLRDGPAYRNV